MTANLASVPTSSDSPMFDQKVVISTCVFDEDIRAAVIGFPWGEEGWCKVGSVAIFP